MAGVFDIELQDGELGQDVSDDDAIEIEEVRYVFLAYLNIKPEWFVVQVSVYWCFRGNVNGSGVYVHMIVS